jgi:hypothetical protein
LSDYKKWLDKELEKQDGKVKKATEYYQELGTPGWYKSMVQAENLQTALIHSLERVNDDDRVREAKEKAVKSFATRLRERIIVDELTKEEIIKKLSETITYGI